MWRSFTIEIAPKIEEFNNVKVLGKSKAVFGMRL